MGISTIAVAVGILGEYVAHFIFERDAKRNRIELLFGVLFGVLVLGGVVGEYIFGSKLSEVAGQLQRQADRDVARLNTSAADATKDAAEAHKEASSFQAQIADANARARSAEAVVASANAASRDAVSRVATAEARIAEAQRGIAEADQRVAEANKVAERERVERLRLEAEIAPRRLTPSQEVAIAMACDQFRGRPVKVVSYAMDAEGAVLAKQIIASLQLAGMAVSDSTASLQSIGGFSLGIHITGTKPNLISCIRESLSMTGHLMVAPPNTEAAGGFIMGTGGGKGAVPDATILVGVKPVQ